MIACLAKNPRGVPLFKALAEIDPSYVYLGEPHSTRGALIRGFVASVQPGFGNMKRDARFSPAYLGELSKECSAMIDSLDMAPDAVLYWGATNLPVDLARHRMPYFIVTDGPFDPEDGSYPIEWRPARWAGTYLKTQREVFSCAAHVFTLSDWAREKVLKVHELDPAKVSKCGWGPIGTYGTPRLGEDPGRALLLSVGSEWRRKGMDVVAEAGATIHAEDPTVDTLIAGLPVDLAIEQRPGVSLLPHRVPAVAVHALMREATCLVHTARFDASPHVLYEALQYGTPVIATRTCGVPEAVLPGSGYLIDRPDATELATAVRSLLGSDRAKLRSGALEAYRTSGGWPAVAAKIHRVMTSQIG